MSSISFGRDVLAIADDEVLGPPGNDEVVAVDPAAQITGTEIPFAVEGFGFVLTVQVTDEHLRAAGMNLCTRARRAIVANPARPSVSAAWSGSSRAPTVVTGTSVEPYTRVTAARSK